METTLVLLHIWKERWKNILTIWGKKCRRIYHSRLVKLFQGQEDGTGTWINSPFRIFFVKVCVWLWKKEKKKRIDCCISDNLFKTTMKWFVTDIGSAAGATPCHSVPVKVTSSGLEAGTANSNCVPSKSAALLLTSPANKVYAVSSVLGAAAVMKKGILGTLFIPTSYLCRNKFRHFLIFFFRFITISFSEEEAGFSTHFLQTCSSREHHCSYIQSSYIKIFITCSKQSVFV